AANLAAIGAGPLAGLGPGGGGNSTTGRPIAPPAFPQPLPAPPRAPATLEPPGQATVKAASAAPAAQATIATPLAVRPGLSSPLLSVVAAAAAARAVAAGPAAGCSPEPATRKRARSPASPGNTRVLHRSPPLHVAASGSPCPPSPTSPSAGTGSPARSRRQQQLQQQSPARSPAAAAASREASPSTHTATTGGAPTAQLLATITSNPSLTSCLAGPGSGCVFGPGYDGQQQARAAEQELTHGSLGLAALLPSFSFGSDGRVVLATTLSQVGESPAGCEVGGGKDGDVLELRDGESPAGQAMAGATELGDALNVRAANGRQRNDVAAAAGRDQQGKGAAAVACAEGQQGRELDGGGGGVAGAEHAGGGREVAVRLAVDSSGLWRPEELGLRGSADVPAPPHPSALAELPLPAADLNPTPFSSGLPPDLLRELASQAAQQQAEAEAARRQPRGPSATAGCPRQAQPKTSTHGSPPPGRHEARNAPDVAGQAASASGAGNGDGGSSGGVCTLAAPTAAGSGCTTRAKRPRTQDAAVGSPQVSRNAQLGDGSGAGDSGEEGSPSRRARLHSAPHSTTHGPFGALGGAVAAAAAAAAPSPPPEPAPAAAAGPGLASPLALSVSLPSLDSLELLAALSHAGLHPGLSGGLELTGQLGLLSSPPPDGGRAPASAGGVMERGAQRDASDATK
ncbi:hypothetical protein Agub_g11176, partial [Astrephomene gubernaculifera]